MSEPFVAVHVLERTFTANNAPDRLNSVIDYGRFVDDLASHGLRTVITHRGSFKEGGIALEPRITASGVRFTEIGLATEALAAMRNHVVVPAKWDHGGAPMLNENKVKEFIGSKERAATTHPEWQVPTYVVRPSGDSEEAAEAIRSFAPDDGDRVVVKPDKGGASIGVSIMTPSEAQEWLTEYRASSCGERKTMLIQPFLADITIPEGVYGASKIEQEAIDAIRARNSGPTPVELRCYATVSKTSDIAIFPVLRVGASGKEILGNGTDTYHDVVLDSELAGAVDLMVRTTVAGVRNQTGVQHLLGAVDISATNGGNLYVTDANFRSPGMLCGDKPRIGRSIFAAVAATLGDMSRYPL